LAKALVFDVDGTLVTFHFDVTGTRNALLEELRKRGLDTSGLGTTTPTQLIMDAARDQVLSGKSNVDIEELRAASYRVLDEFEMVGAELAEPFPETRPALEELSEAGVRMAVLTNSGRKAAETVLRRAGIEKFFEFVLTRNEIATMKPRPEGLRQVLDMLRLPALDVFYVGDSPLDIAAAKAAGVKVISVATGNYDKERLVAEGADFVLGSIAEVGSLVRA